MKNYSIGILYATLLLMAFGFFAFMDEIKVVSTVNVPKQQIEKNIVDEAKNGHAEEYTYSPLRFVNGYN